MISNKTQQQNKTKLWNQYRKFRITASKCKRALQKPTTSPTKATNDILHYKPNLQSQKMRQGLQDESKILKLYEDKLDCKVHKVGFIISGTRPFLGTSPDEDEEKRIFPKDMSLQQAICSRGICKMHCVNLTLNKNHQYFYQVQQQLYCMEYKHADLILSDLTDMLIFGIKKTREFADTVVPKLEEFYENNIAIDLAYPRLALGLPRLANVLRNNQTIAKQKKYVYNMFSLANNRVDRQLVLNSFLFTFEMVCNFCYINNRNFQESMKPKDPVQGRLGQ